MKVVYVAGPYRDPSAWEREQNVRRAEALALEVWRTGKAVAICPHTLARFYEGAAPDSVWLEGDMELLRRSDAILMTDDWRRSSGAYAEHKWALQRPMPVLYSLTDLRRWLTYQNLKETTDAS